jgi:predicted dinucleotide-binding enzyme
VTMRIGIIGSGNIGATAARLFAAAGQQPGAPLSGVLLSEAEARAQV